MFGEEKMFGQSEVTIDNKNRIVLPASTKREEGDNIVLIEDKELNIFRIYPIKTVSEMFDAINDKISKSISSEKTKIYKKELYELSKTILRSSKVDKLGRINVGELFSVADKIKFTGACDHLILELKK